MTDPPLRVAIADDAVLLRDGLVRLLEDAGLEVVAAVGDADALLDHVRTEHPELVIIDIRMPPTHTTEGLDAAVAIREFDPTIRILVLSQYVEPHNAIELLRSPHGGIGYLLKDRITDSASFMDSVRRVADGGSAIDPQVVAQLLDRPRHASPLDSLSDREREVLRSMAEGASNKRIADRLHLSPKTLEKHVASILQKLDLPPEPEHHRRVLAVLTYLREADTS
jgi:DNA-binding NarL/FixJ family response regulator